MNKKQLIAKMAEKSGLKAVEAQKAFKAFIDSVNEALVDGEAVQILGFGSFQVKERAAREGINPATREKIAIPAKKVVKFKPGKGLSEKI